MGVLRLAGFAGMWPIRDPRALPDNAAVDAVNIRVGGGAYLKGSRKPMLVATLQATTKSVYRLPLPGSKTLNNSYWMQFADIDTDVVRGPIVNDQYQRIYWASPSTGLKYAPRASIIAGSVGLTVGVPAPVKASTITVVEGTGEIVDGENVGEKVTRSYVYTYVNEYGEESAPSPAAEATGSVDQDWFVEQMAAPPAPGAYAQFQFTRVYRTVTGETGGTAFYKVIDLPAGTTFYMDRLSDLTVSGKGPLESTIFAPPPPMDGLVALPNGIFAGWKDNNLYFSENYRPHAWPAEYTLTTEFPIVGLGVYGNTVVVCTTGNPVAVSGMKSSTMSMVKIDAPLPCLSRRSIVSAPEGVYYASEEGLILISPSGPRIITEELIDRAKWRTEYKPDAIKATITGGQYTALTDPQAGYEFRPPNPMAEGVARIDMEYDVVNIGVEPFTGKPWVLLTKDGTNHVYEWEPPGAEPHSYTWLSREFHYPKPANFSVFQAYFDASMGTLPHLRAWVTLRGNNGTTSRVLVYDADIAASGREIRFPSGFKGDIWQFEFSGIAELQSFMIATTVSELRSA